MSALSIFIILLIFILLGVGGYFLTAYFLKIWPFKKNPLTQSPSPWKKPNDKFTRFENTSLVRGKAQDKNFKSLGKTGKTDNVDDCEQLCDQDKDCMAYTWFATPGDSYWDHRCFAAFTKDYSQTKQQDRLSAAKN